MKNEIAVIGGGLAGCEAGWQAAKLGARVDLFEMRPQKTTEAHKTENLAELVCSNSLGSEDSSAAAGNLKRELSQIDSLLIKCAHTSRVPAGQGLTVDRILFAKNVENEIKKNSNINLIRKEISSIPNYEIIIIATGPLTSPAFTEIIKKLTGNNFLYFYDATSPIVSEDSINYDKIYFASRYQKGEASFINCPFTKEEYENFHRELVNAETIPLKEFEEKIFFESCLPVEEIGRRGKETLRFGKLKPVGLAYPESGKLPYAVAQLRPENLQKSMYNLIGFQTRLKIKEQQRIFRMIPGLSGAKFLRYGVMHRNTFINSPELLRDTLELKTNPKILFAGQITGVEGYTESIASGWLAGFNAGRMFSKKETVSFPPGTFIGALIKHITSGNNSFQPMNVNWGLMPRPREKLKSKQDKKEKITKTAQEELNNFMTNILFANGARLSGSTDK